MAAWVLTTVGDVVAASRVIAVIAATPRVVAPKGIVRHASPTGSPLRSSSRWWPLPIVLLLLALAAATRRGTRLTADTEGLV